MGKVSSGKVHSGIPGRTFRNWAGNQRTTAAEVRTPRSAADVARAVLDGAAAGRRVRMAGSGHSFTGAALTDGLLLRPDGLTGVRAAGDTWVTAGAGTTVHDLNLELDRRGLALANMGDITAQTVSGAIQTGTHGSGRSSGGLADQVLSLEMVLASGEIVTVGADDTGEKRDLFDAARVGLGALGVLTAVTFRVEPAFLLHCVRRPMALTEILDSLDNLTDENDHLDFHWMPHTDVCLVKLGNRTARPASPPSAFRRWLDERFLENTLFGFACAVGARHPPAIPSINAIAARLLSESSHVDASHKVFATLREVRFLETEYAVPREHLGRALRELRDFIDRAGLRVSFPVEVRVAPPSDAWLSTAYGRATAYIACHVYWRSPDPGYFAGVEEIMTGLGGRPHWGKLHNQHSTYLGQVYPRLADFIALRERLDPDRLFMNDYLEGVLG
ncbi:D-arabinono-1,4-lactone oxidase [Sinosporangium siamense]|uniref:FAD-linked oxidoreductase n=1 Tax=Sinosporangium siamense TaxID=1367973 RepID=A0A919RDL7_9ACTN|nr:D-arabinono-1,4-lactone oxidase [Sinosporangium siamense]GII91971.1 FAD-linked oxidoreductase [Sinosporangium siamense]